MLTVLANLIVAAALLVLMAAVGSRLRRLCGWALPPSLRLAVDVALGSLILAVAVLLLGLLGWLRVGPLGVAVVVLACGGRWRRHGWRWRHELPPLLTASPLVVVALTAPFFYDALIYHLGLPWQALLEGRLTVQPGALYGASPALPQLLAVIPLALGALRAPALMHWASFVLGGAVIFAMVQGLGGSRRLGALAAAAFPVLAAYRLVPGFPAAEGWGALALLAAFAVALLPSLPAGGGALAGLLAGIATAARIQALPLVLLLAIVLSLRRGSAIKRMGAASLGWLAGSVPWWLKNLVLLGDPLAPLGWHREGMDALWRDAAATMYTARHLGDFLRPYATVLWPHFIYLGPLLLVAVGVVVAAKSPRTRLLAVAFLGGLAGWGLTGALPRFLVPALGLLLVLAALPSRRAGRVGAAAALAVALVWGLAVNVSDTRRLGEPGLVTASRETVWAHLVVNDPLPAFTAADALPEDARVLFVGEPRPLLFPRRMVAPSYLDLSPLRAPLETLPDAGAVIAWLRHEGFTHLLINWGELRRLAARYPVEPWRTEAGENRFAELVRSLRPGVVATGGVEILALPEPGSPGGRLGLRPAS